MLDRILDGVLLVKFLSCMARQTLRIAFWGAEGAEMIRRVFGHIRSFIVRFLLGLKGAGSC